MPRPLKGGELSEAIPPAYTEWLGAQLLAVLGDPISAVTGREDER